MANETYTLNGYEYSTDDQGRIVSACGLLHTNPEARKSLNDAVEGMLDDDERGHIIADIFGGSNLNGNLVAQSFEMNREKYRAIEREWQKALGDHKDVIVLVNIRYGKDKRPTSFVVEYFIDNVYHKSDELTQ